jgi:hypothetical protein
MKMRKKMKKKMSLNKQTQVVEIDEQQFWIQNFVKNIPAKRKESNNKRNLLHH